MDNGTSTVATETTGLNLYDNSTFNYNDGTHVKLYVDGVKKQGKLVSGITGLYKCVGGGFETNNPPVWNIKV